MTAVRVSAFFCCAAALVLSAPAAPFVPLDEINDPRNFDKVVTTAGTVVDVFCDEVDPAWQFLILRDRGAFLPVGLHTKTALDVAAWLDAEIRVTGVYCERNGGVRRFSGPFLSVALPVADNIRIETPAENIEDCAPLDFKRQIVPIELVRLGRRSADGTVLARWGRSSFALRTDDGRTVLVRLRQGMRTPAPGLRVRAVGYPETDLYAPSLSRAVYREQPDAAVPPVGEPCRVTLDQMILDASGRLRVDYDSSHGKLVTLSGLVRQVSKRDDGLRLVLGGARGTLSVVVDPAAAGDLAGLAPETEIELTGVCLILCETWNPNLVFPRIRECRVFVRDARDVRVLRRPPWWTPARLASVIFALGLGLVVLTVWITALRRLVVRRGRALFREQIARVEANLRTDERTRLAVELHDALSQNLEGVAFQVAASKDLLAAAPDAARRSLEAAGRMLQSSRTELKRCLFDLRHDALGATTFDEALRTTLDPISGDADLRIRFNVRRSIFTDRSAHMVLCIVRELVSNALRHGAARHIRVAGEHHEEVLSFSVSDDGRGFAAGDCPGPDDGHFGLEGVRERIRPLGGTLSIESAPGGPTRLVVTIPMKPNLERTETPS